MNKNIMGAFTIFIIVVVAAVATKFLMPIFEEKRQKSTSDASQTKGKITIALDNWIGYFIINSDEMKIQMRKSGYILTCDDDKADYASRMKRLKEGEIDFAVATVDSYILNGNSVNYPGAIVMVIDESKGGDAILARKDKIKSLDDLKGKSNIRVAFTPDSPSHHLAKACADHFNVPEILPKNSLRIETDGSKSALEKLIEGKADVAIGWEPDVSRALRENTIIKLLGTEDTNRLIVDILIVNRNFVQKNQNVVTLFLNTYFRVLKKYRDDEDLLVKHVKSATGLDEAAVKSMLKGVKWVNFNENCENWFGIAAPGGSASEGLFETMMSTVRILINTGDFSTNPLPDEDPYRITNSSFLEAMFTKGVTGFTKQGANATAGAIDPIAARFPLLDDKGWANLKEVGTLKVEPIVFQQGATELDLLAKSVVDQVVERLKHYPNFRIVIKGHTGTRGDQDENLRLSLDRADAVARYLEVVYDVDVNRMNAIGFGGTKPLKRKPGESLRTWKYRLSRVEIVLVREDL